MLSKKSMVLKNNQKQKIPASSRIIVIIGIEVLETRIEL